MKLQDRHALFKNAQTVDDVCLKVLEQNAARWRCANELLCGCEEGRLADSAEHANATTFACENVCAHFLHVTVLVIPLFVWQFCLAIKKKNCALFAFFVF